MLQTFGLCFVLFICLPAAVISAFNENTVLKKKIPLFSVKCLYPIFDLSSLFTSTHLWFGSSPKIVL